MGDIKVAKANVYKDAEGNLTEDASAGVELFLAQGQEVTAMHVEAGVKGVEPEAENKSDVPESENKSGRKK